MKTPHSKIDSPAARIVAIGLLAGAMTQLILSASAAGPLPAGGLKVDALTMGNPIEREIGYGETHAYEVIAPRDRVVVGTVDQRGVDLVVRVIDPAGATVATIDSPNGMSGPEPWTITAKTAGAFRIEVTPLDPKLAPGRYEARIDEIITSFELGERKAKLRYQSPRMRKLWREHQAEGAAAIDRLAKEMEGHAPLVEPVAGDPRGDVLITFLWRSPPETRYVALFGGPVGTQQSRAENAMMRFEDTNLWYLTSRTPKDVRITYKFRAGEPMDVTAQREQLLPLVAQAVADPWNPRNLFGTESFLELPGAPAQPWTQRSDSVKAGRVVKSTFHSKILGEDRAIGVYLPAAFDPAAGPYPYIALTDGEAYGTAPDPMIPTPVILDNLIAQGKVPPMLGLFIDSQSTRTRDLTMSAPFCEFITKELVPWLRREYRATEEPAKATLAGFSFGGLCATYCAFHHTDVFGNALSQSASFWFSPGILEAEAPHHIEPGALMREVVAAPRRPLRVWMEVGIFEDLVAPNRHMRDVLMAKGYDVSYHEYSGGHILSSWRGTLADGIIALAGKP